MSVVYPDQTSHTIAELKNDLPNAKGGLFYVTAGDEQMTINAMFGAPGQIGVATGMSRMKKAALDDIIKDGGILDTFVKDAPPPPAATTGWGSARRRNTRRRRSNRKTRRFTRKRVRSA